MGETSDGDRRPADAGREEHTQPPYRAGATENVLPAPEKAAASHREGRLDLSVPQVAGSAIAAIAAAKLASNLGVYGTIAGAGVVSVLGTCGGSLLQHVLRRTGRHVQEVAVQARPGARRIQGQPRSRTDAAREADHTRRLAETDLADPGPLTGAIPPPGGAPLTGAFAGEAAGTDSVSAADPGGHGGRDGYGDATSYRARRRGWKRPVVGLVLAFGLTMGGITGYEAIAGENISGHGHGTTIGNAVTGHSAPHSGGTRHSPTPGGTDAPSGATTTGPHGSDGGGRPAPGATPPSWQHTSTPPTDTTSPSSGPPTTPPPTSPDPTSAPPSPTATPNPRNGDGGQGVATP